MPAKGLGRGGDGGRRDEKSYRRGVVLLTMSCRKKIAFMNTRKVIHEETFEVDEESLCLVGKKRRLQIIAS